MKKKTLLKENEISKDEIKKEQEPTIRVDGEVYLLSESQTGKFGITRGEFLKLIIKILSETKSGSRSQRDLFKLLLKRMGIRTHGKLEQEYFRDYIIHLRQMKEEGLVEFVSGKTKVNVRIV